MAEINSIDSNWPVSSVTCPHCNNQFSYFDRRKSAWFGCTQCGTFFERNQAGTKILRLFNDADRDEPPLLPFGTRGIVDGKEYSFVGYITKKEEQEETYWNEYAFYAPGENWYLMLAEIDGHWMIIRRSANQRIETKRTITGVDVACDDDSQYVLCLSYRFTVVDAGGEFDWNILDDEELITYEYVAAPNILVNESRQDTNSWFRARYIAPKELMQLFDFPPELFPPRSLPAPFNPGRFYPRWKPLVQFTFGLLSVLLFLHVILFVSRSGREVYTSTFNCEPDTSSWGACKPIVTPSFAVNGPGAVSVSLVADQVDNNWIELPVALINDNNGKVYEINKTIEYYHGYEDGDSWSEGGRTQDALVSGVPSGNYHLNIYPATESAQSASQMSFGVSVKQNVFLSRNFWLFFLLIITYPLIQVIRKTTFENSKWFPTGYGTYKNE